MKQLKQSFLPILFLLIIASAGSLSAAGTGEHSRAYRDDLQQTFDEIITDIYNSSMNSETAKDKLAGLRNRHNIYYTDEAGVLDAIIDRAGERSLSSEESRFYFKLLQDGTLMEFRRNALEKKQGEQFNEIINLIKMKFSAGEPDADELLRILNNYYDFIGLEYDEGYYILSRLLEDLKEGSTDTDQLTAEITSLSRFQTVSGSRNTGENMREYRPEAAEPGKQTANPTQGSDSGSNPSGSSPQASPSGSEANSQKPENAGPETRR